MKPEPFSPRRRALTPTLFLPATRPIRAGVSALLLSTLFIAAIPAAIESKIVEPDLGALAAGRGWKIIDRSVTRIEKDGKPAIRFSENPGIGIARLEDLNFGDGAIEFDARGKDVPQRSFLGVAFHGADDRTYDAVYFRPFNFKANDPVRRQRAVQYISHPTHTWHSLRERFPGKYESAVEPVPDPNGWFHVRIVVAWPKVSVFVNGIAEPCLAVEQLSERKRGWLALWVDVSSGDFANLKITPATSDSVRK